MVETPAVKPIKLKTGPGGNQLNFHQLYIFYAVASHHSFSRAAEALEITQPAVSIQIQELEKSLGATLFHSLTGVSPFEDLSGEELMLAVFRTDPPPPSRINPEVAPELDAVVLKAMEKDPARRYPSAEELADELDRYLRGEPVLARPIGAWERVRRWVSRNRLVAVLTLALLLTMLVLAVVVLKYSQLARSQ